MKRVDKQEDDLLEHKVFGGKIFYVADVESNKILGRYETQNKEMILSEFYKSELQPYGTTQRGD